jgi:hypothetical protein
MAIEIDAVVATKIGFASHRNAVPFLADLQIRDLDAVIQFRCLENPLGGGASSISELLAAA